MSKLLLLYYIHIHAKAAFFIGVTHILSTEEALIQAYVWKAWATLLQNFGSGITITIEKPFLDLHCDIKFFLLNSLSFLLSCIC